jgi:hypothetical protein
MTIAMQPIYTQTVGAGGAESVSFFSIPQNFTDLKVLISSRSVTAGGFDSLGLYINGSQANFSNAFLTGNGTSAATNRSTYRAVAANDSAFATANTFANTEIYIPNYTGSNYKQMTIESVTENNAAASNQLLGANLWSQTAPITTLTFDNSTSGTNFAQYSTFTLYGITKG